MEEVLAKAEASLQLVAGGGGAVAGELLHAHSHPFATPQPTLRHRQDGPWSSLGETQVNVNSWTQEIGRCMNEFEILINTTISYQWTIFCTFVRYPPGESLNLVF